MLLLLATRMNVKSPSVLFFNVKTSRCWDGAIVDFCDCLIAAVQGLGSQDRTGRAARGQDRTGQNRTGRGGQDLVGGGSRDAPLVSQA